MSLSSSTNRADFGVTSATNFPFAFKIFDAADLEVTRTDSLGVETVVPPSLYTVNGVGSDTGSIDYPTHSNTDLGLVILRVLDYTQPTVLRNQSTFYADVVEKAFDRVVMLVQQVYEILNRSLKVPVGSTVDPMLPMPAEGTVLGWVGGQLRNLGAATAQLAADLLSSAVGKGTSLITYLAPYTGAVARTLLNKLADTVNVNDFGASPGASADVNNAAFQTAANALTSGGILNVGSGTYSKTATTVMPDEVTVQGAGVDATLIQMSGQNLYAFSASTASGKYAAFKDFSVDNGHTMDRTSAVVVANAFVQWTNTATMGGIYAINANKVVVQNVKVTNTGEGIAVDTCNEVLIDSVEINGAQWDGIITTRCTRMVSMSNITVNGAGRNGIITYDDEGSISISKFTINDCWCNGIEIEHNSALRSIPRSIGVRDGYINDCGAFVSVESYYVLNTGSGTASYATVDNVYMGVPKVQASFGNKTTGYCDRYYNLNTGAGWTGTPTFPVPNVPGTWSVLATSGVNGECPTLFSGCTFKDMSTAAITNVTGPVYAYAIGELTKANNITFKDCRFINSNVLIFGGEYRDLLTNFFLNSSLTINSNADASQNPSSIILGNSFEGKGVVLTDNASVENNIFRNIVGVAVAVDIPGAGADSRTTIAHNKMMDVRGGSSTMTYGIQVGFQSAANSRAFDNYIYGATVAGIDTFENGTAKGYTIESNRIEGCAIGVKMRGANGTILSSNIMRGNTTADIDLNGNGGVSATAVRLVGNILQSTPSILADNYSVLPGTTRWVNNEFATLSPANTFSWGGSNVVQGNWN